MTTPLCGSTPRSSPSAIPVNSPEGSQPSPLVPPKSIKSVYDLHIRSERVEEPDLSDMRLSDGVEEPDLSDMRLSDTSSSSGKDFRETPKFNERLSVMRQNPRCCLFPKNQKIEPISPSHKNKREIILLEQENIPPSKKRPRNEG